MELPAFQQQLGASRRVLALVGAGLGEASGFPAFWRPEGGPLTWRGIDVADLATPEAFDVDPRLVWQFHAHRRQTALESRPNAGHVALARLAQLWGAERFLTLSQGVDALSEQAGHPSASLVHLHGELFVVRCTDLRCGFSQHNYDAALGVDNVPTCPRCQSNLRPAVTWFGEPLPYGAIVRVSDVVESGEVDLVLCVGLGADVWPAAGYVEEVVARGGKVAVFNTSEETRRPDGWFFAGSAEQSLPMALAPFVGHIEENSDEGLSDLESESNSDPEPDASYRIAPVSSKGHDQEMQM